jgi:hypothetical protein
MRLWVTVMALVAVYDLTVGAWPYALAAAAAAALALGWLHFDRRETALHAELARAEDEDVRRFVSQRWAEDWDSPEDSASDTGVRR